MASRGWNRFPLTLNPIAVPGRERRLRVQMTCLGMALISLAVNCLPSAAQAPLPPAPDDSSVQQRLDQLESMNRDVLRQLDEVREENESLTQQLKTLQGNWTSVIAGRNQPMTGRELEMSQPPDVRTDQDFDNSPDQNKVINPFLQPRIWASDDGEWTLNFHNETQLDIRSYAQPQPAPVDQFGFYIPRMRIIFNGHLTKPIEYNFSINKGLGSLDMLDAYLNFNYDPRMQFRFGRYRAPFTYDWYALSNQFLTSPERSVFALNYGYNRNVGGMVHGELLEKAVEYAVGAFIGPRNAYYDTNNAKDLLAYLNVRPFQHSSRFAALKYLNLGGSLSYGEQDQSPQPVAFHTSVSASSSNGSDVAAPAFLVLNGNVIEKGQRNLWEAHMAYYYKQLTVLAAIDGGENTYAFTDAPGAVAVPVHAWHVQFGYFLTGEEITRRTFVDVLRPFDLREGKRGPGAWELQARFDRFDLGDNVFNRGLANPAVWTNGVSTIDCGLNWYLNRFVKIDFDWQHCSYSNPVQVSPGHSNTQSDLFWIRFQDYF